MPTRGRLTAADARKMSVVLGNADVPWVDQGGNQSWAMQAALSPLVTTHGGLRRVPRAELLRWTVVALTRVVRAWRGRSVR